MSYFHKHLVVSYFHEHLVASYFHKHQVAIPFWRRLRELQGKPTERHDLLPADRCQVFRGTSGESEYLESQALVSSLACVASNPTMWAYAMDFWRKSEEKLTIVGVGLAFLFEVRPAASCAPAANSAATRVSVPPDALGGLASVQVSHFAAVPRLTRSGCQLAS